MTKNKVYYQPNHNIVPSSTKILTPSLHVTPKKIVKSSNQNLKICFSPYIKKN